MTTETYKFLDIEVSVPVAATSEEYNQLANRKNPDGTLKDAACEDANTYTVYHRWASKYRVVFLHGQDADPEKNIPEVKGIEELTGIERESQKNDKGEIEKYTESEATYFSRVCAKLGKTPAEYQDLANQVAQLVKFDPSASERSGVPAKTAKAYLDAADQIIAANQADGVAAALAKILGKAVEPTREGLGKAIAMNEAKKRAEENKKLAGQYTALVTV